MLSIRTKPTIVRPSFILTATFPGLKKKTVILPLLHGRILDDFYLKVLGRHYVANARKAAMGCPVAVVSDFDVGVGLFERPSG